MARWLVLTLAGVGLFALMPGPLAGPTSARWLASLSPMQVLAAVMIALAWLLFAWHILQARHLWLRDGVGLALAASAALALVACVVAFVIGVAASMVGALIVATGLNIALCARIDALTRRGPLPPRRRRRTVRPAPAAQ